MPREIKIGSHTFTLPDWAPARITVGILFVGFGLLGFLPVVGFWMIPIGIAILAYDIPYVRLLRQKFMSWWRRSGGPGAQP